MWRYVQIIFPFVSKNLRRATVIRTRDPNRISFSSQWEKIWYWYCLKEGFTPSQMESVLYARCATWIHSPIFEGNIDVQRHNDLSIRARIPSPDPRMFLFLIKIALICVAKERFFLSPCSYMLSLGLLFARSCRMSAITLWPVTWSGPLQKGGDAKAIDYKAVVDTAQACIALGIPRLVIVSSGGVSKPDSSIYLLLNLFGQIMENKFQGRSYCRVPTLDQFLPADEFIAFFCLQKDVVQSL